jgi:hypothetical protein
LWTNKEVTREEVERVTREERGNDDIDNDSNVLNTGNYVTKEELELLIKQQNKANEY